MLEEKAMEAISSYWGRRTYERLDELRPSTIDRDRIIRLGGGGGSASRKRSWKKVFRVRVRMSSAKKFILKLRDAYFDAMLALAGGIPPPARRSVKVGGVRGRRIPRAREVGMKKRSTEFERRVVLHVYNILVAAPPQLISNSR